jgi:hypothetical protein
LEHTLASLVGTTLRSAAGTDADYPWRTVGGYSRASDANGSPFVGGTTPPDLWYLDNLITCTGKGIGAHCRRARWCRRTPNDALCYETAVRPAVATVHHLARKLADSGIRAWCA